MTNYKNVGKRGFGLQIVRNTGIQITFVSYDTK